jgi:hypothetical protein
VGESLLQADSVAKLWSQKMLKEFQDVSLFEKFGDSIKFRKVLECEFKPEEDAFDQLQEELYYTW